MHIIAVGYEIVVFLSCRGVADIRAAVREKKYRNPAMKIRRVGHVLINLLHGSSIPLATQPYRR